MTDHTTSSERYAAAYSVHYSDRDLPRALRLYRQLLASDPSSPESAYSRMQVVNIVNEVVPKQELFDANINLALVHLGDDKRDEAFQPAKRTSVRSPVMSP